MFRPAPHPRAVLLITSAAAFLVSLDLFIVNIAFPDIRADFPDTDLGQMSWILNGYTVVFAAFLALAGRLGDRSGHKRVFLAGVAVFTLASAACVVAPSVWVLVGARALQALGGAMVMPTSLTLLFVAFPVERRSWAVGTSAMIGALAAALGPPLGGILVESSWHWVFLVNIPIGVLAFAAGIRLLPASPAIAAGRPDVLGAAALIVSIGAVAFALVRAPDIGWTATEVITALIVATLGLAGVVLRSRHHPVPAVDLSVIRVPAIGIAALALVAFMAAFAGMLVINVLYLTGTWGWSAQKAGVALMPGPLTVVGVSYLASHLTARLGVGSVAAVGALVYAAGPAWWIMRLGSTPDYVAGMLPGQIAVGVGVGLILPTLSSVVGSSLPDHQWGTGSSLIATARQVGAVLGVALLITVIGTQTTGRPEELGLIRNGWLLLSAAAALAMLISIILAVTERRGRRTAAPPPYSSETYGCRARTVSGEPVLPT